ncbi:hypothetical protein [Pleionea litopenaei]|uniref:Molybdenum ABC transporter permease n=1 Tax=Pleionea litopenaei TaxID=3070815 RepID=A0AA51RWZ6_9GAMM|nr:hypothetical protein [Pleionea sp. HL-JVS1]WMS89301.1 hypothetical protein Q9312_19395 [Pleionea sp. HL-JVS1]WMS89322.1 hypothetical protein Q9312_19285 [Pleionea sp. HL-JVS1]
MTFYIGLITLAIGLAGTFVMKKKAFERRNTSGVEGFNSYWHFLGTRGIELLFKLLIVAGALYTFAGLIMNKPL